MRRVSENGPPSGDSATKPNILNMFDSLRGHSIENKGQVDEGIRFYSTGNLSVAFRDGGVFLWSGGTRRATRGREVKRSSSSKFKPLL